MVEYIERKAVLEILRKKSPGTYRGMPCYPDEISASFREVNKLPAADVVEVVHGRWEDLIPKEEKIWVWDVRFKCSECGYTYSKNQNRYSYCPDCGARMDGE